eukprot:46026-Heterocapsa_arctica.AAC.1
MPTAQAGHWHKLRSPRAPWESARSGESARSDTWLLGSGWACSVCCLCPPRPANPARSRSGRLADRPVDIANC